MGQRHQEPLGCTNYFQQAWPLPGGQWGPWRGEVHPAAASQITRLTSETSFN